jgi:hypothetical protein
VREVTSAELRASVVAEMAADWPRYSPFIPDDQSQDYLANMARPGTYAGQQELVALSQLYGVPIHVWGATAAHDVAIIAPNVRADAPTVHVAHRNASSSMNHYWAVDIRQPEVRSPTERACAAHACLCAEDHSPGVRAEPLGFE